MARVNRFNRCLTALLAFFLLVVSQYLLAANYNLTTGVYPPCTTYWSVAGSVYTCQGNGQVSLSSGDTLVANSDVTLLAKNGFNFSGALVGSDTNSIGLVANYGKVTITGPSKIYGNIKSTSSNIALSDTDVYGTIKTNGNIVTNGGSVSGLITTTSNTISTHNTHLLGGATAKSGMTISGGTLKGDFTMTSKNGISFSDVTMISGSIRGGSHVNIEDSTLGSAGSGVDIKSESNGIKVTGSTVYGKLEAPDYSQVTVSSSDIYGQCIPKSSPANACKAAVTFSGYALAYSASGISCEASAVTVTAVDDHDNPVNPPNNTTVYLAASGAEASWNINSYTYDGTEHSFTAYLRNPTSGNTGFSVSDNSYSASGNIYFAKTGLVIDNASGGNIFAGFAGENIPARLRAITTNDKTGACEVRASGVKSVAFSYDCVNPSSCIAGQVFTVNATDTANPVAVNFNADGEALLNLRYTDVGKVRLHAQLPLPAQGEDPAITLAGESNAFVVKPYTIKVTEVTRPDAVANPKTKGSGAGFVAAGESFSVQVKAFNSAGKLTPNFGREQPNPQTVRLQLKQLVYPAGGDIGVLSGGNNLTYVADNGGSYQSDSLHWSQVGTMTLEPHLTADDYLGAGDLFSKTTSENIGRFYPLEYRLSADAVNNGCGSFTYMGQPAIAIEYRLGAYGKGTGVLTNYDNKNLSYLSTASPRYVAENANDGNPLNARVTIVDANKWDKGLLNVAVNDGVFARASAPEAPLKQLQLGLAVNDSLDYRSLAAPDMNAGTATSCAAANNCNAHTLGNTLNLRYGRLHLASAYGPERVDLPVAFITEYYRGARWEKNIKDACTAIARSAITYKPTGTIDVDSNRTITLAGGSTTGDYANLDVTHVNFSAGDAGQYFSAPGAGHTGRFSVDVDLSLYPWLSFDWNRDGTDDDRLIGQYQFGSYRGNDRIIYWREVLD